MQKGLLKHRYPLCWLPVLKDTQEKQVNITSEDWIVGGHCPLLDICIKTSTEVFYTYYSGWSVSRNIFVSVKSQNRKWMVVCWSVKIIPPTHSSSARELSKTSQFWACSYLLTQIVCYHEEIRQVTGFLMVWGLFDFKEQFLDMLFLKTEASALVEVFQWQINSGGSTASRAAETNYLAWVFFFSLGSVFVY